jgi:hypothetical protein
MALFGNEQIANRLHGGKFVMKIPYALNCLTAFYGTHGYCVE